MSELFQKGYEYRSVNSYRSAISAFHPEINGIKVGQSNLIKQVMSGVFNSRPPMPRYNHTWDVDIVLKYLISLGPCENLGLKLLTLKVASLMALSTACRSSELYHLDLKFMQISPNEIVFKIVQLTKTRKVGMEPVKLIFKEYENERLDVRKHIMQYLKITEPIRNGENKFFLIYLNPRKPVRSCTIARWLKTVLGNAGIDTSIFKAHSTRGASTSKANKLGLSVKQIMELANWKSANTFYTFYNKPIENESEFSNSVLKVKEN